jgi:hypothetical protein
LIKLPFPLDHPVTLPLAAVQENVVPATFWGAGEIEIIAASPLHIITFEAVADGTGFTVIIRSTGKPLQPLKFGVIL